VSAKPAGSEWLRANAGIANRSAGMSDIKVGKRLPHQRITGLIVFSPVPPKEGLALI
jgi:hypothetical protein